MQGLTRRSLLTGLAAGAVASGTMAEAPLTSAVPPLRLGGQTGQTPVAMDVAEVLIAAAGLTGEVAYVLADLKSGAIVAERQAGRLMPPASTAKTITSLYALDRLGAAYRFQTRIMATGPIKNGNVQGDLLLVGGGDPTLTTDGLGDMAAALAAAGVRSVSGRFHVWSGALPYLASIDPGQPVWMGYDPAVSGLNLNFNRVNLTWERTGGGYQLGFDARADRFAPAVNMVQIKVVARETPLFTYQAGRAGEIWTVAEAALGKAGSRWLPVRRPDLYAGDVLRTLAAGQGIALPEPEGTDRLPEGTALARHMSAPLPEVLRAMMKYSTNVTAEVAGMMASGALGPDDHAQSARAMSDWLEARIGAQQGQLVDHSGLGATSRICAEEMVRVLGTLGPQAGLPGLMKDLRFGKARPGVAVPRRAVAKSGTLNFVSGLVGYLTTADGAERVFAIYAADMARHDAVTPDQMENPPGLSGWLRRARRLQLELVQSWA